MNSMDRLAKMLFFLACMLVMMAMLTGCSEMKNTGTVREEQISQSYNQSQGEVTVENHNNVPAVAVKGDNKKAGTPVHLLVKGNPIDVPAPELVNINLYAEALQKHLLRRYNNTPRFAGKVAKVQLIAEKEPEFSLDRKKIRINWSQVVMDSWGKRIPELEEEYYVVVFGDGKPLMQRTRPSITIGLNNESGYSEFSPVRGGELSKMEYVADPAMFDKPDVEQNGLLDDHLQSKDTIKEPYGEYDIEPVAPPVKSNPLRNLPELPVVQPAGEELQALVVLEKVE